MAKIIITEKGRDRLYEIIEDEIIIGGSRDCNLQVRDPMVAQLHCQIRRTPQGWKLVDCETKQGTTVNGRTVNQHLLKDGDRIQIGSALLKFQAEGEPKPREIPRERLEPDERPKVAAPKALIVAMVATGIAALILVIASLSNKPKAAELDIAVLQEVRRLYDAGMYEAAQTKLAELDQFKILSPEASKARQEYKQLFADRAAAGATKLGFQPESAAHKQAVEAGNELVRAYNHLPFKKNRLKIEDLKRRIAEYEITYKDYPEDVAQVRKILPLLDKRLDPKVEDAEPEDNER